MLCTIASVYVVDRCSNTINISVRLLESEACGDGIVVHPQREGEISERAVELEAFEIIGGLGIFVDQLDDFTRDGSMGL